MIAPQANRWKLGLFVTLVVALGMATLIALGAAQFNRQKFSAVTYFDETVQGLDVGSALKWRGVAIGSVSHIGIAPDGRHVEVHMDVYSDLLRKFGTSAERIEQLFASDESMPLREVIDPDSRVRLVSAGITGLKFIELDRLPGEPIPSYDFPLPPNYVPSAPSVLVGLEMGVSRTVEMLPELLDSIDTLVGSIDSVVGQFGEQRLAESLGSILRWADDELHRLDTQHLAGRLDGLTAEAQATLAEARTALAALGAAASSLQAQVEAADPGATAAALRGAASTVQAMGNETGAPGASLGTELRALRELLERTRELVELIERQPDALLSGRASEPAPGEGP